MKWLIYFLLLLNLGFGLFHYRSIELANDATPIDDDNLRLVLLEEYLEQTPKLDESSNSDEGGKLCNTLGPFKSKSDANVIRTKLEDLGIPAQRRMSKDNTRKGFWVMIPPADSRSQAKQYVRDLKSKNIKDYFLVVTGEQTNAVSLGVFSRSELAQNRYDEIKAMGFEVKIRQVDLPLREYWLDWSKQHQLLPEVLDQFRERHPNIGQTERSC